MFYSVLKDQNLGGSMILHTFNTQAEAWAFGEGVSFVNDSSLKVYGVVPANDDGEARTRATELICQKDQEQKLQITGG